jgi:hypothetical protein
MELKSSENGSLLTFTITRKSEDCIDFDVQVKTPFFTGSAPSSTFMAVPPEAWFRELADNWTGWTSEKKWGDLESRVLLSATTDSTGHIKMTVTLNGDDYDTHLRANLMFEAGQLERIADDVAHFFK